MSARTRVLTIAGLAAALAVAAIVGATLLQSRRAGDGTAAAGSVTKPRAGAPPLLLDLGVRDDVEARALSRAAALYRSGHRLQAGRIFARYHSLPAQIGAAFAAWPDGGLDTLKQLVASHPRSALAELHLGWAYYWSGRNADAVRAWGQAVKVEPDSSAAVSASDLIHPSFPVPGLPYIVTTLQPPPGVASLPAARGAARPPARRRAPGREREGALRGRALESPPAGLGRAGIPCCRGARPERPDGAHRGRRRLVLEGTSGAGVLAALARSRGVSPGPESSASISACSCSGRASSQKPGNSCSWRSRSTRDRRTRLRQNGS